MTILDLKTFGSEKAAKVLAEILNEINDPRLTKKVSCFLTEHNTLMKQIDAVQDVHARLSLTELVAQKIKSLQFNWPDKVLTYSKNVALSRIKRQKDMDSLLIRGERAAAARARALEKNKK